MAPIWAAKALPGSDLGQSLRVLDYPPRVCIRWSANRKTRNKATATTSMPTTHRATDGSFQNAAPTLDRVTRRGSFFIKHARCTQNGGFRRRTPRIFHSVEIPAVARVGDPFRHLGESLVWRLVVAFDIAIAHQIRWLSLRQPSGFMGTEWIGEPPFPGAAGHCVTSRHHAHERDRIMTPRSGETGAVNGRNGYDRVWSLSDGRI